MADNETSREPVLKVKFYETNKGNEPVREWIKSLPDADRKVIGEDLKTAQYGWPIGMPLIRKLEPRLWEVRSRTSGGLARLIFTVSKALMVILHGFIKKSQKMPQGDLETARQRLADLDSER